MRLAGLSGEGGRDGEKRTAGLRERAVKRGEAQIVADGQAEPPPWQVGSDTDFAGTVVS
jgi:hypothetical protein